MAEEETDDRMSAERSRGIRRLLILGVVFEAILAVFGVLMAANGYGRYGGVVLLITVVLAVTTTVALRALRDALPIRRRACILAGVLFVVLSVPLIPIWIGLLTALLGIGLLVVVFAPEHPTA